MLPSCLLVDEGVAKGKLNFTTKDAVGRRVEVQLAHKAFYLKASAQNMPWKCKPGESPHMSWAAYGSASKAWEAVLEKLGGWDQVK